MTGEEFEAEVLRIARAMWPRAAGGGSSIVGGRERDAVFITDDQIALIEATTSRTKVKAEQDGKKLDALARDYGRKYPMHAVKGWFVTMDEPTADQRDAIRRLKNTAITAVSFAQFRSRLVDARTYLDDRLNHPFGSARALDEVGSYRNPGPYVRLDILEVGGAGEVWSVSDIVDSLLGGHRIVMLGDFGAGKSMTMREVFLTLVRRFRTNETWKFPVHLNLGEHLGQTDPAEALMRHGQRVGFHAPHQLVRAWKSGYAVLLLDGFDEMAATNWSGDPHRVKDARRRAVQLVRQMNDESDADCGMLLAGREHYFDSSEERRESLGYDSRTAQLSLNDFSDEQVKAYLQRKEIPAWLPRRPFLLGYLAARGLLPEGGDQAGPAEGWSKLLDGISAREARVEAGIDGSAVRRILERLASYARATADGLGPFTFDHISRAFRDVVGQSPDEADYVLLQRLPGLGVADAVTGSRRFIDVALVETACAGDPVHFVADPFSKDLLLDARDWHRVLGTLGADVLAHRLELGGVVLAAQRFATENAIDRSWHTLAFDLIRAADAVGAQLTDAELPVEGVWIDELDLGYSDGSLGALRLGDSVIQRLDVNAPLRAAAIPEFVRCSFGHVEGVASAADLPAERFVGCSFESFSPAAETTQAILRMRLPLGTRVGLTILKKLYLQRGTGRRDGALRRGLDQRAKGAVDPVLKILQAHRLAVPARVGRQLVWLPIRAEQPRVLRILSAPMTANDSVMSALEEIRG